MKMYIQICDDGRRFRVSYGPGVCYGTFEFVTVREIAMITYDTTARPDWMATRRFNQAVVEAQKLYIANQVVGVEDQTCHEFTVL